MKEDLVINSTLICTGPLVLLYNFSAFVICCSHTVHPPTQLHKGACTKFLQIQVPEQETKYLRQEMCLF